MISGQTVQKQHRFGSHIRSCIHDDAAENVDALFAEREERVRGGHFGHQRCLFFPKALRRVLPENPLNTDTSILTLTH